MGKRLAAGMWRLPSLLPVGTCPPQPCPAALFQVPGAGWCWLCQGLAALPLLLPWLWHFSPPGISHPCSDLKSTEQFSEDIRHHCCHILPPQGPGARREGKLCWESVLGRHCQPAQGKACKNSWSSLQEAPCKSFQTNLACECFMGHHLCVALTQQFLFSSAFECKNVWIWTVLDLYCPPPALSEGVWWIAQLLGEGETGGWTDRQRDCWSPLSLRKAMKHFKEEAKVG